MVARSPARRRLVRAAVFGAVAGVGVHTGDVARADDTTTAALMRPGRVAAPLGEIRLQPQPGCVAGAECAVAISADLHPVAGDRRRVAVVFDWPASAAPRGEGAWRCRPLTEREAVCFARPEDIAAQPASRLVLRLPAAENVADPRLCPRPVDAAYRGLDGGPKLVADERQVRLLQAFADEARGGAGAVPDGVVAGETRQALQARAREASLPVEPEAVMVAALVGQELNRGFATLPGCVALITPPRPVATDPAAVKTKPAPNTARATPPAEAAYPPPPPPPTTRGPTYAPAPFEDTVLLRPWRIRPLNGLRRLFGG